MMVRESKKTMILDAAIQVIEEDGITAVTFDRTGSGWSAGGGRPPPADPL